MSLVADTFVLVVVVEHDTRFEGGGNIYIVCGVRFVGRYDKDAS
jgi:hypothetical protein